MRTLFLFLLFLVACGTVTTHPVEDVCVSEIYANGMCCAHVCNADCSNGYKENTCNCECIPDLGMGLDLFSDNPEIQPPELP